MRKTKIFRSDRDFRKRPLLSYFKRRLAWTFGRRRPLIAYVKVTQRCNLDCYYCPWHTRANDYSGELETGAWKTILSELFNEGIRLFIIEGGEPTVRDDLEQILSHISSLGAHSVLATNCTARDPWQYQPTVFTTSVDGPEAIHDAARGAGTYKRVVRRLRARGTNRVFAITVVSRENSMYIRTICEELQGLVSGHLFTFLYPYKGTVSPSLSAVEVKRVKEEILNLKRDYLILNPDRFLTHPLNQETCHDALTVSVSYQGEVKRGCFVQHVEPKDCETCELACFHLVSAFHNFNLEAWFNLNRFVLNQL